MGSKCCFKENNLINDYKHIEEIIKIRYNTNDISIHKHKRLLLTKLNNKNYNVARTKLKLNKNVLNYFKINNSFSK